MTHFLPESLIYWQIEFGTINQSAALDDLDNLLRIIDVHRRVRGEQQQIGELALLDRAEVSFFTKKQRAVLCRYANNVTSRNTGRRH